MRPVIAGVGMTRVAEIWDTSLRRIAVDAAIQSMENAKLGDPQAIFLSNMMASRLQSQDHLGTLLADELGISGISAMRVEAACASGGAALHAAFLAVRSGVYQKVLVVGAEKMSDRPTEQVTTALMTAEDREYTAFIGASFVGLNALVHRSYMERYGLNEAQMAQLAVLSQNNAVNNPLAQFRIPISVQNVLNSPYIAEPIHLLEAAGIGDGAAAVIVTTEDAAISARVPYVKMLSCSMATDSLRIYERDDLTYFRSVKLAADQACSEAGITPDDMDLIEVHDAFTIVGYLALEGLGIVERGKAPEAVEKRMGLDGRPAVNTLGGLKGRGHPIGATGIYQVAELYSQLIGNAGKNQVEGAKIGAAVNIGGVGTTSTVTVLGGGQE